MTQLHILIWVITFYPDSLLNGDFLDILVLVKMQNSAMEKLNGLLRHSSTWIMYALLKKESPGLNVH